MWYLHVNIGAAIFLGQNLGFLQREPLRLTVIKSNTYKSIHFSVDRQTIHFYDNWFSVNCKGALYPVEIFRTCIHTIKDLLKRVQVCDGSMS